MKTRLALAAVVLQLTAVLNLAQAQSTAFTYQGRLNFNGVPVNGTYDFEFAVYDASAAGTLVAPAMTVKSINVVNGLFVARLDFGSGVFTGPARWLQISFSTAGAGVFTTLDQRLELTSSPYSIRAQSAGVADSIGAGTVVKSLNGLRDDVVLAAGANVTLTPNGNTLTLSAAGGGGGGVWSLSGSSAYYNGGNVGIGINNPLERLTIAGVPDYNNGLMLSGNSTGGTGLALENTSAGGHKYALFTGGSGYALGAGGFAIYDDTAKVYRLAISANGNVGVNSYAPAAQFEVASSGGEVVHLIGASPNLSFYDSKTGYARHALQSTGGGLTFMTDSYLTSKGPNYNYMVINNNGNVGIGSFTPAAKLDVASLDGEVVHLIGAGPSLSFYDSNTGYARHALQSLGGGLNFLTDSYLTGNGPLNFMVINNNGNVGIGNADPQTKLDVVGDVKGTRLILRADPLASANAAVICDDPNVANFVPYNTANARPLNLVVRDASVRVLTITGGADLAEPFAMSDEGVGPGSVMVIDEKKPGHLKLSTQAYDKRVAGVVSGANGIKPGISLHQEGALEGSENVALSGRVYVLADSESAAIAPGDLLTTSPTPGHAMRAADPARAQGAILGKAMTGLNAGRGLVLVLVTLQ